MATEPLVGTESTGATTGATAGATTGATTSPAHAWSTGRRTSSAMVVVAVGAAVTPIVIATARALARGWMPISENALFELRARDVLTSNTPLLGTASSVSITSGTALNHPGPILFEWLAAPVRVFGGHAGVAIGVAVLNIAVIIIAAVFARRVGGDPAAVVAMLGAAFVGWIMGSELLYDPWNPNVLMLSAYALIVVAWAIANGELAALPWAALIASICLQTHLSYVYLVPITLLGALLVGRTRPTRRQLGVTAAVVLVTWLPPLAEQLRHGRNGNLWGLARAATHQDGLPIGSNLGTRLVAAVLTNAPWNARVGFATAVPPTAYTASGTLPHINTVGFASACGRMAVLIAALVVLWWWARRRDTMLSRTAPFTLVVIGGAWFSVTRMPVGAIGLSPHQMRWLWSIAGWLLAVVALVIVRSAADSSRRMGREATLAVTVLTLLVGSLNVPTFLQPAGPALVSWRIPSVRALTDETVTSLRASPPRGAIWIDTRDIPYFDVYYQSVMAAVDEAGFEFQVDDPVQVRQVGPRRALNADATVRLHLLFGLEAFNPAPDESVIATVGSPSADQIEKLTAAIDEVNTVLATDGIALTTAGQQAAAAQQLGFDPNLLQPDTPPNGPNTPGDTASRVQIGALVAAWQSGFLVTDPLLERDLETIASLTPSVEGTIVVVLSPTAADSPSVNADIDTSDTAG